MRRTHSRPTPVSLRAAACLAALALAGPAAAAVTITGNVAFNAGTSLFSYSYSVTNTGTGEDLALITVPVDPASALMGISAPAGFDLTFDPSQGWVNFNEDTSILTEQTFAPGSTVAPFQFTSAFGPGTVTYTAFDAAGTEFTGTLQAPVPEPSAALLTGLTAGVCVLFRRRRAVR